MNKTMSVVLGKLGFCLILTASSSAQAGVIRHDRNDTLYRTLAAAPSYAAVGDMIINNSSRCSGTAIASTWVLTAAHCVDDTVSSLTFTVGGVTYSGIDEIVHQNWTTNLTQGWDIALVQLGSAMTGISFAQLYAGAGEVGQVGTNVGFGRTGTGLTGNPSPSGTKRAGNNMIDATGTAAGWSSNILFQDFDNPLNVSDSTFGASSPLNLEYLIAPGDSGGGLFIDIAGSIYLAGVHSFGSSWDGDTNFDYGDLAGSTRVSSFLTWIDDIINPAPVTPVTPAALPEPGSLALLGLGLSLLIGTGAGRRAG
jgi:hypothetical protein